MPSVNKLISLSCVPLKIKQLLYETFFCKRRRKKDILSGTLKWLILCIQGGPGRSGQTLGSYRKFNSEQKISYKHGSKNASLRSCRSKISQIVIILHIFPNNMEDVRLLTKSTETKVVENQIIFQMR